MASKRTAAGDRIYRMRVSVRWSDPEIWREVEVPACLTLLELHHVLQALMNWDDSHLHEFEFRGVLYGDEIAPASPFGGPESRDEADHCLADLKLRKGSRIGYTYDFGDNWELDIAVQATLTPESGRTYPVCVGGQYAPPPEDCGGLWGYGELVGAWLDPDDPEHDWAVEILGEDWDLEDPDVERINKRLKRVQC